MARNENGQPDTTGFPIVTKVFPDFAPPIAGLDIAKKKVFADYLTIEESIAAAAKTPPKDGKPVPPALDIPMDKYVELVEVAKKENKPLPSYQLTTLESDLATLMLEKKAGKPVPQKLEQD